MIEEIWDGIPKAEQDKYNEIIGADMEEAEAGNQEVGILVLALAKILLEKRIISASELSKARSIIVAECDQQNAAQKEELGKTVRENCPLLSARLTEILGCDDWEFE